MGNMIRVECVTYAQEQIVKNVFIQIQVSALNVQLIGILLTPPKLHVFKIANLMNFWRLQRIFVKNAQEIAVDVLTQQHLVLCAKNQ